MTTLKVKNNFYTNNQNSCNSKEFAANLNWVEQCSSTVVLMQI